MHLYVKCVLICATTLVTIVGYWGQIESKTGTRPEFAFGGALYIKVNETAHQDPDVIEVAEFAMETYTGRLGGTISEGFHVQSAFISKLLCTMDGTTPHIVYVRDPATGQPMPYPIVWGAMYTFNITQTVNYRTKLQHSFVVLQYLDHQYYLLQHTFYQEHIKKDNSQGALAPSSISHCNRLCTSQLISESPQFSSSRTHKDAFLCVIHRSCDIISCSSCIESSPTQNNNIESFSPGGRNTIGGLTNAQSVYRSSHSSYVNKTLTLRILSFNIWNVNVVSGDDKAYVTRIEHLARLCRESNVDIIGLQEVRFQEGHSASLGPNQMDQLSKQLPEYQYVFRPAQVQTQFLPDLSAEGVAFMSKYPITDCSEVFLKRNLRDPADGSQRILLHAEVEVPLVGNVHVFNTHLSLSHKARATSVLKIWDYMSSYTEPTFLMGDFNAEPHNVEVQYLDGRATLRGQQTKGLSDVWRIKHGLETKGFTFNTLDKRLSKRIDLIFMQDHQQVSLKDVWKLDDKTRRKQAASDHLGLVAEFSLTKAQ